MWVGKPAICNWDPPAHGPISCSDTIQIAQPGLDAANEFQGFCMPQEAAVALNEDKSLPAQAIQKPGRNRNVPYVCSMECPWFPCQCPWFPCPQELGLWNCGSFPDTHPKNTQTNKQTNKQTNTQTQTRKQTHKQTHKQKQTMNLKKETRSISACAPGAPRVAPPHEQACKRAGLNPSGSPRHLPLPRSSVACQGQKAHSVMLTPDGKKPC